MPQTQLFQNPITWEKRGLIIKPRSRLWWMKTHVMIPTPEPLGNGLFKVYFSGRNEKNQSHIGWAIVDVARPHEVLDFSSEPVLCPGRLGCFDDNGVTPSCVVDWNEQKFLYYIGWNPGSTVRMHLFGGLAASTDDGKTFRRLSEAPILERIRVNPFLNTAPFVLPDGDILRMYYVSGVEWVHKDLPRYNIQYAESRDGMVLSREGRIVIDFANDEEMALARPWVIKEGGIYKMWFAHKNDWQKGSEYRLGYAESIDGLEWHRRDDLVGIDVSANGFDSEMIEYAAVVVHAGQHFMFYNGNNYGRDGIGFAVEA